eukprot:520804-Prymnesium_polylepis.2
MRIRCEQRPHWELLWPIRAQRPTLLKDYTVSCNSARSSLLSLWRRRCGVCGEVLGSSFAAFKADGVDSDRPFGSMLR